MDAAQKKAQQLIDDNAVMVFSKSYCPYCNNTKRILDGLKAKYTAIELNQESDGDDIQNALHKLTGQRTVPNIFINRVHIGGNSDLEAVVKNGKDGKKIEELLAEAGAL
ncbi:be812413-e4a4-4e9d-be55-6afd017cdd8c [Thermothielavioides terrestris]|uniref:Be812413-e4a4-4e9d-be55-6afd017cdd8c n=1 Tax=Thermothielavioides terrestris TaxID=2587410 RepID=A0A3S4B486_9PEZI|nr:be812413-e4a4-4e9d-be55-6afd017cdd8c [Thermothielavioides terrestris]